MRENKRLEGSTFAAVWHRLARCTCSMKTCFSAKQPCTLCAEKKSKNVGIMLPYVLFLNYNLASGFLFSGNDLLILKVYLFFSFCCVCWEWKGYPVSHCAHGQNNEVWLKANETEVKLQSLTFGNNVFALKALRLYSNTFKPRAPEFISYTVILNITSEAIVFLKRF